MTAEMGPARPRSGGRARKSWASAALLSAALLAQWPSHHGTRAFAAPGARGAAAGDGVAGGFAARRPATQPAGRAARGGPPRAWRSRPSRRVLLAENFKPDGLDEKPDMKWAVFLTVVVLPLMCYFCSWVRRYIEAMVRGKPPWVEVASFLALAEVFYALYAWKVFASSSRAVVDVVCTGLRALKVSDWRVAIVKKLGSPVASITQATILFLAINSAIAALPEMATFHLPKVLAFVDSNGDGLLQATEIEDACFMLTSRILLAFATWEGFAYLRKIKEPTDIRVNDEEIGPVARFMRGLQRLAMKGGFKKDPQFLASSEALIIRFMDKVLSVLSYAGTALVWSKIANLNLGAMLAIGGVGGLAVSLAAKNIMQNLISGALIFLHRAVVEGDEVQSTDGKIEGVVQSIRATNTVIQRKQGEPLIVPNAMLVDNAMINVQRRNFWLLEKNFPVMLQDFAALPELTEKLQTVLDELIEKHLPAKPIRKGVYQKPLIYFDGFGHQGADIKVRAYVDGHLGRHEFYKLKSDMLLAINKTIMGFEGKGIGYGFEAHHISGTGGGGGH